MTPQITEVVLVTERPAEPEVKIRQVDLAGVVPTRRADRPPNAVFFAADHKPVEMGIRPIKSNLENAMVVSDRAVTADQNRSPHGRADPSRHEVELVDFGKVGTVRHNEPSLPALECPVSTRVSLVSNLVNPRAS